MKKRPMDGRSRDNPYLSPWSVWPHVGFYAFVPAVRQNIGTPWWMEWP